MSSPSLSSQDNANRAAGPKVERTVPADAVGVPFEKVPPLLGVGRTTCARLIREGALESVKIGKSRIVSMRSIRALIEGGAA